MIKQHRGSVSTSLSLLGTGAVAVLLGMLMFGRNGLPTYNDVDLLDTDNTVRVEEHRDRFIQNCNNETLYNWFVPSKFQRNIIASVRKCDKVFLDLGANIGDSLGKFINAGIPDTCNDVLNGIQPKYNINTGRVSIDESNNTGKNRLTKFVRQMMDETQKQMSHMIVEPEEYCYYGIEGNPKFTKQLQQLESNILNTEPCPLKYVHFFTETIITDKDDEKTTLYLDTINVDNNYWGSSIYSTHKDVNNGLTSASVTGKTLTSLLKDTVNVHHGNHIIIKIDIEGAEYITLNEAYDSGILCQLAEEAIRIDILVELHNADMIGNRKDIDRWNNIVHRGLIRCGINLFTGKNAGRYLPEVIEEEEEET